MRLKKGTIVLVKPRPTHEIGIIEEADASTIPYYVRFSKEKAYWYRENEVSIVTFKTYNRKL